MSLNKTPRSDRVHIAIFGKRNAGKSSLINALTNQDIALVSDVKGTTTDPVYKSMEILPIGPVVIIDTAGLDDEGELGKLRQEKTMKVLNKTDLAVLVLDPTITFDSFDEETIAKIKSKKIPIVGVINKSDLVTIEDSNVKGLEERFDIRFISVSSEKKTGIDTLKEAIIDAMPNDEDKFKIIGDIVSPGDFVVLVVPIDGAAPKGRLILPQQQVIRDVLESNAIAVVTKEYELKETLERIGVKPRIVITDSQAFQKVAAETPKDIELTSFSILFARQKGDLTQMILGAEAITGLNDNDKVLIAEACTHHRQADDIGSVKIPRWLKQHTGKKLIFEFCSGVHFPDNLSDYSLIVHCGSCMMNKRAMLHRIEQAENANVPIINYGVLIAYVQGILERAIQPFLSVKLVREE